MKRKLLAAILSLCGGLPAFGQGLTSLSGSIADPTGAVIPAATISIENVATSAKRDTVSDASGRYTFPQLQPGTWHVTAKAKGFSDLDAGKLELLVSTPATVNLTFKSVGSVAESISISAEAPQLNTTDASIGNAIGVVPITQLPFEGRNVVGLLALQPGVSYLGEPDPGAQNDYRSGNVNGGKSDQANVTLDGVDVNDQQNRAAFTSVLRVTLDSVQEFRTITTNANADMGRTSGAQITMVTKGGGNIVHGSAYEYLRNTATSANSFFNNLAGVPTQKLNRNVFGASVGGPIQKNRLFYFLNYEGRQDKSESSYVRTVPNDTFRTGTFTYITTTGATSTLSPAQIKAKDPGGIGVNPAVLTLFQSYPHPNDSTTGDLLNTAGYRFNAPTPLRWNTYIAKFDYQIDNAGKHQIFWRGNLQNDNYANGAPQFPGDPASSVFLENSKGYAIGYTAILPWNLISTFRYGFTRQGVENTGILQAPYAYFRDIDSRYARSTATARITPVNQVSDDLSFNRGSHQISFGGVMRYIRNSRLSTANSFSNAYGNSSWLLGSGSDLLVADAKNTTAYKRQFSNLLGLLPQLTGQYNYDLNGGTLSQGAPISRKFGGEEYEMYLQDTWKVTRSLNVTAGLRLSLDPPVYESQGYQTSTQQSLEDWYNQRGALAAQGLPQSQTPRVTYVLSNKGGRDLYPFQKDLAPRISLAYAPSSTSKLATWLFGGPGKTSIRTGFGMFYDIFGQGLIRSADATALGFSTSLQNAANQTAATSYRYQGFYTVPTNILPAAPKGGFPQVQPDIFQITNGVDDKLKAPYTMNLDFAIQREVAHNLTMQVAYVGRLSRRSLIRDDLAMPTNLKDPKSGMTYFEAARQLTAQINAGVPTAQIQKIPFFENLWPNAATKTLTSTQNIYNDYKAQGGDYTTALYDLDVPDGGLCCSILGPYAMFNSQYSTLSAFRSRGSGSYHALQVTLRKAFSNGIQFDANYTYSKSEDLGSTRESATAYAGTIINSWFPGLNKGVSDYDQQHVFSAFWVAELPFGQHKRFFGNANKVVDAVIGGWALNGVFRNSSGLPVGVTAGGVWPTNWESGSYAIQTGTVPTQVTTKNAPPPTSSGKSRPNLFANPAGALAAYSLPLAGDAGQRNGIRGDGYFGIDLGMGKKFNIVKVRDQQHTLQFRAEGFNVTNTVRFDPGSANLSILNPNLFGQYTATLTKPRVFQFSLRYEF